ncbi:13650_t:CDS:2 [Ambispora gerdemannii]|uniref:13650_t:CDS:1 n=1 Tax=Ambispora gerdemannii TaxID=144530 RepID=A0A9N9G314_9GLOM|nr:13650_t:CDS:2 [Ambispora gerdemannii]
MSDSGIPPTSIHNKKKTSEKKFKMPTSLSLKLISNTVMLLSFKYSDDCAHKFTLNPHTNEFKTKILDVNKINKKLANYFLLFRSCLSNAVSKDLHCTEKSCPLSSFPNKDNQCFISELSSFIHQSEDRKRNIFGVFSRLYKELESSKKQISTDANRKEKLTQRRNSDIPVKRNSYAYQPYPRRSYSDSEVLTSARYIMVAPENLLHTSEGTYVRVSIGPKYFAAALESHQSPDYSPLQTEEFPNVESSSFEDQSLPMDRNTNVESSSFEDQSLPLDRNTNVESSSLEDQSLPNFENPVYFENFLDICINGKVL